MAPDGQEDRTSFISSLFLGDLALTGIFPFPTVASAEQETLAMVVDSVQKMMAAHEDQFAQFDHEGAQPSSYIDALKELGLFGLIIPEENDGIGLSSSGYARVLQEVTRYDGSTALTIGAHSSIGLKGLLLFGTDEQKATYLPRLATGDMVAAFCLTEPSSGSDAASIKTRVRKREDGGWVLNGEKIWITNGAFADFFTVFARHEEEDGKISAFLVDKSFGGVTAGKKEDKMGIRASATTSIFFKDVPLPATALLGEEGKGFKVAMSILNSGRAGLAGGCVGAMKQAISLAINHAQERKQFGTRLIEFPLIQQKLSKMVEQCFATESLVQVVGAAIDSGTREYSIEAAAAKIFGSEALWSASNEALQIAGGAGFMKEYPYERMVRDARINMIFEGTNEVLRLFVALAGLRGVGDYLRVLGSGLHSFSSDPLKGFELVTDYALKKWSQLVPQYDAILAHLPPSLHNEGKILAQYTARVARAAEAAVREHRREIVDQQLLLARLADSVIRLTVAFATLSRVSALLAKGEEEGPLLAIARLHIHDAKREIARSLRRLGKNEDKEHEALVRFVAESPQFPWEVLA